MILTHSVTSFGRIGRYRRLMGRTRANLNRTRRILTAFGQIHEARDEKTGADWLRSRASTNWRDPGPEFRCDSRKVWEQRSAPVPRSQLQASSQRWFAGAFPA